VLACEAASVYVACPGAALPAHHLEAAGLPPLPALLAGAAECHTLMARRSGAAAAAPPPPPAAPPAGPASGAPRAPDGAAAGGGGAPPAAADGDRGGGAREGDGDDELAPAAGDSLLERVGKRWRRWDRWEARGGGRGGAGGAAGGVLFVDPAEPLSDEDELGPGVLGVPLEPAAAAGARPAAPAASAFAAPAVQGAAPAGGRARGAAGSAIAGKAAERKALSAPDVLLEAAAAGAAAELGAAPAARQGADAGARRRLRFRAADLAKRALCRQRFPALPHVSWDRPEDAPSRCAPCVPDVALMHVAAMLAAGCSCTMCGSVLAAPACPSGADAQARAPCLLGATNDHGSSAPRIVMHADNARPPGAGSAGAAVAVLANRLAFSRAALVPCARAHRRAVQPSAGAAAEPEAQVEVGARCARAPATACLIGSNQERASQ